MSGVGMWPTTTIEVAKKVITFLDDGGFVSALSTTTTVAGGNIDSVERHLRESDWEVAEELTLKLLDLLSSSDSLIIGARTI